MVLSRQLAETETDHMGMTMMIRNQSIAWLLVATIVTAPLDVADARPTYDNTDTQALIEAMVEAHGGQDAWLGTPSFNYTYVMYLASLPVPGESGRRYFNNWRLYEATLEPRTSRGYLTLPLEESAGPHVGFDGERLWRRPYDFDPSFQDSPFQLLYYHYAMISLPWLTQMDGVVLDDRGTGNLPSLEVEFRVVRMSFSPKGKTHGGHYDLYIDPQTDRLAGWIQTTRVPILPGDPLPAEVEGSDGPGRIARVVDQYAELDGKVIPIAYSSLATDGSDRLFGIHLLIEPSFRDAIDVSMLEPSEDAEVVYQVER
jgi:hypothetical protein